MKLQTAVRLTESARDREPVIGAAIGIVHGVAGETVEVTWPRFRSFQRRADLEPADVVEPAP